MGFLRWVFRRRVRDVAEVEERARVEMHCRVSSVDDVVSPVTGTRAALVRWSLLEQQTVYGSSRSGGGSETRYHVLAQGLYGAGTLRLVSGAQAIEVPLARARLALVEDPADGELLGSVPPALRSVVAELAGRGPLAYREAHLAEGDHVELTATLERIRSTSGVGYRDTAGEPHLRALPDEPILLRERIG